VSLTGTPGSVSAALFLALTLAGSASVCAEHHPFLMLEARMGGGLAIGAGHGNAVLRGGPFTAGALLEFAVWSQPWTTAYVGAFVDAYRGAGLQLQGGVRLRLLEHGRISAGLIATVVPYTLFGVSIAPGVCHRVQKVHLCGDAQADVLFIGGELPERRVAIQLQLVFGAGFDVL